MAAAPNITIEHQHPMDILILFKGGHKIFLPSFAASVRVIKAGSSARGEPWLSQFDPDSLVAKLKDLGFAEISDFGPEEANARYFSGRTDGLHTIRMPHLMKAGVGGTF